MKLIPLSRGQFLKKPSRDFAMVDDEDFERVSKIKWNLRVKEHTSYAQTTLRRNGKITTDSLHRFVMRARRGSEIDHKNGNGLDCQKSNLRFCSKKQNCQNRKMPITNTSGFKGVHFHKAAKKWDACIGGMPGMRRRIGFFTTALDAAKAYDAAAIKYFGAFAKTNKSMGLIPCH